jgi:hypothetical protein
MKHLIITAFVACVFSGCQTKETTETKETVTEPAPAPVVEHHTTVVHDNPPPEKQNKFEMTLSDTGSGIKVKIP